MALNRKSRKSLKSEEGLDLEIHEGVVLDAQGKPLTRAPLDAASFGARGFKITTSGRLTWPLVLALGGLFIFVPILVTAGFAILMIAGILFGVAMLNQKLGRAFRSRH